MIAVPLLAASGHSGTIHPRTAPELSDIALFVVAVAAIWFVRRAMRRRFDKRPVDKD
ncbi:hypothetical protein U1701_01660 [Sphingomonas sp. PB2P19]|uniref:hypothetical protein n=1 Tax=Sphingomonas rhamnosi TaxID=3096156 RepID=UPI002FCB8F22